MDADIDPGSTYKVAAKGEQKVPPDGTFSGQPEEHANGQQGERPEIERGEPQWKNETCCNDSQIRPTTAYIQRLINGPEAPTATDGLDDCQRSVHETRSRRW